MRKKLRSCGQIGRRKKQARLRGLNLSGFKVYAVNLTKSQSSSQIFGIPRKLRVGGEEQIELLLLPEFHPRADARTDELAESLFSKKVGKCLSEFAVT